MQIWLKMGFLILCLFLAAEKPAIAITIDLHSHVFMKEGMGPLLRGSFDEPTKAGSWESRFGTKITQNSLDASGLKLIVISLYAHPVLTLGKVKEKILAEIAQAEKFVASHPNWVIASEPAEARTALAAGRKVFVLSLETAGGILETEADQDLFIRDKKIRIVTFVHLSPDHLGRGVALWPGVGFFNSPLEYLEALWIKRRDPANGALLNPYGLSPLGKKVLGELVARKVWIDLAHASDQATVDMIPVLDHAGQPALVTHTKLREFGLNERTVPNATLERVKRTHGLIGLIPTDDMTKPLTADEAAIFGVPARCRNGIRAYAEEWRRAQKILASNDAVTLGSDFNAPIRGLSPCAGASHTEVILSEKGFYRAEDLPKLSHYLEEQEVDSPEISSNALKRFLDAWSIVRGN